MDMRRWILILRLRTGSVRLSYLMRRPHLSVRIQTYPAPGEAVLGWPVRVSAEIGPAQLDSVRFVFNYFSLVLNCFKYVSDMIFKL
jgi:hypothetical protein